MLSEAKHPVFLLPFGALHQRGNREKITFVKRKTKHKNRALTEKTSDKRSRIPPFDGSTSSPSRAKSRNRLWVVSDVEPPEVGEDPPDLKLLEILIKKIIKKLEDGSYQPKVQDALKAIQLKHKLAPTSENEKTFWQLIQDIKRSEYERRNNLQSLEAKLLKTIIDLKEQVKNSALPVKTITDAFNQGKSKESKLTYHRMGRRLSAMGFTKVRTSKGSFAILWDDERLTHLAEKYNQASPSGSELVEPNDFKKIKQSPESSDSSETSVHEGDQNAKSNLLTCSELVEPKS